MKRSSILRIILPATLLIVFTAVATEAFCMVVDKIIAVVNGEIITQREVSRLLIPIYEQYRKEYTGRRLENKMIEAEDMILDQLVDDKLILSEAKRQGIAATDKEIELKLQTVKDRFGTEKQFRETLAEQNISLSELRDSFKNEIIKSKLVRKEVGWKITITPSEVRKYYDNHIEDFTEPEKARVLNILVKKPSSEKTGGKTKFLVERIRELIREGKDFEELAKEYSEGPNASEGGSLGLVEKGQMREEIDAAIFSLEAGEVSDIVESPIGYHLFKVMERIPEKNMDFESVEHKVEELFYRERIAKSLKKWLKELRRNAYISVK